MRKLLVLVYVTAIVAVVINHQVIADWWFLQSYRPDPQISALADRAYLSDDGRRHFYVSNPEINDKKEFNSNCPVLEKALVLGCYSGRQIYVLEIGRSELEGVMEVTAAHEMLHAAYDRLGTKEREDINGQLLKAYESIDNPKLRELIESYEASGGEELAYNELHSILPTQVKDLPENLEDYFRQYFNDRQKLVGLYAEYESVFLDINRRIDSKKSRIEALRSRIDTQENFIGQLKQQINDINSRMQALRRSNDTEGYNRLVPRQNALVEEYNTAIHYHRDIIEQHNKLVNEVNDLVILQNDLVNSMDSRYEPL